MENSKSKAKSKPTAKTKKTVSASKTTAAKRTKTSRSLPKEDEIRVKAQEIYHERISRGEHGTPEGDWLKAEKLLTK